ncbi:helix-turn-helix transcriptional regulator [Alterisphingorhabdus coralli]|uniref:AlpA family phage regulatory protein n=1 Tax=Alterisphingorhabdus coralli TaxID=3071408 RepID=A0AA97F9C8_9SPHN|nr:AlpA family phage regulatory protein [Parasphingorhabdus sp. SCSIO 66989]WOE76306.1 AlpA family phage regulatory protein [Parasphingorhabdus sp. SCSIO 66989]
MPYQNVSHSDPKWMRLPEVIEATTLSKATIYRKMDAGIFPQSHRLRDIRAVVWFRDEVMKWKRDQVVSEGIGDLL